MNDSKEYHYTRDGVAHLLKMEGERTNDNARAELARLVLRDGQAADTDFFLFSVSKHKDQLSQWRAYTRGTGGYAIGFRSEWLQALATNEGLELVRVEYGYPTLIDIFNELFPLCYEMWKKDMSEECLNDIGYFLYALTYRFGIQFKHKAFAEEAEWRLVAKGVEHKRRGYQTRARGSYMLPYRSVSFANLLDFKPTIKPSRGLFKIVLGPGMDEARARLGLEYLRETNGLPNWTIVKSAAPYRTD